MGIAEVEWKKCPFGENGPAVWPPLRSRAPCHGVSVANATAVHCRHWLAGWLLFHHQPLLPPHSDVSSTQRLTQHYSHVWLVDQRKRQERNRTLYPLLSHLRAPFLSLKIKQICGIKMLTDLVQRLSSGFALWLLWCSLVNFLFISWQPSYSYCGLWWCYLWGYTHTVGHHVLQLWHCLSRGTCLPECACLIDVIHFF